jgi:hypothetical protein
MMMTITFRPLGEVKMILEEAGIELSYAYDDLVFVDHTAYLFQFDDKNPANLKLFFNTEIDKEEASSIEKKLIPIAQKRKFRLTNSGYFSVKQKEDTEELEILFFPKKK